MTMHIIAALALLAATALTGDAPYASKTPLPAPRVFAPGEISTGDFESHPAFSPDGKTLYFLKDSPNFSFWTLMVSHFENGKWTSPSVAPWSGRYRDADPFVTADGKRLYFISDRPVDGKAKDDLDIWSADIISNVSCAREDGAQWPYDEKSPDKRSKDKPDGGVPLRADQFSWIGSPNTGGVLRATTDWWFTAHNGAPNSAVAGSFDNAYYAKDNADNPQKYAPNSETERYTDYRLGMAHASHQWAPNRHRLDHFKRVILLGLQISEMCTIPVAHHD